MSSFALCGGGGENQPSLLPILAQESRNDILEVKRMRLCSCLWIFILLYSGIKLHCPALGPLVRVERDLVGKKSGFFVFLLLLQLDTPMLEVKYQRLNNARAAQFL